MRQLSVGFEPKWDTKKLSGCTERKCKKGGGGVRRVGGATTLRTLVLLSCWSPDTCNCGFHMSLWFMRLPVYCSLTH